MNKTNHPKATVVPFNWTLFDLMSSIPRSGGLPDAFSDLEQNFHCGNNSATLSQLIQYVAISWWVDGILQTVAAVLGVLIFLLVTPILLSRRMRSVFNCLVTILLFMQTVFILSTCFETLRQIMNRKSSSYVSNVFFAFVLYPAKNGLLYYSIYMATVMARERYIAVRCPIRYHNETAGINPWRRAFCLSLPVLVFCTIFVIPIFFEAKLVSKVVNDADEDELSFPVSFKRKFIITNRNNF